MMEIRIALLLLVAICCIGDFIAGWRKVDALEHENAILRSIIKKYSGGTE